MIKINNLHTSLDDLERVVTPEGLDGGYWVLRRAIESIEKNKKYSLTVLCEPQMSKHKLFTQLFQQKKQRKKLN